MSTKGSSSMKNKRPRKGEESPPDPKTRRATKGETEFPIMSTNGSSSSKNKPPREGQESKQGKSRPQSKKGTARRLRPIENFPKELVDQAQEKFQQEVRARLNVSIPDFTLEEFEDIAFEDDKAFLAQTTKYAEAAIKFLKAEGLNYNLVKPGLVDGTPTAKGALFHVNFKAKRSDDPDAPVESFITQVSFKRRGRRNSLYDMKIDCCISLGFSEDLPAKTPNLRDCGICRFGIHHPAGPQEGLNLGWDWK